MKKLIMISLMVLMQSMVISVWPAGNVPPTLRKWKDGSQIRWRSFEQRGIEKNMGDWRDRFPSMAENVDEELADRIWGVTVKARATFHRDNLWILTSGNDSLAAAMIDVEWAFEGLFFAYMMPLPGASRHNQIQTPSVPTRGAVNEMNESKLSEAYNKMVKPKMDKLLEIKNIKFDAKSESVRFALSINKWCNYSSVQWDDSDSLVEECPEQYYKRMGRGHQRADVRSEWIRVQNSIREFRKSTDWLREKGNKKIDKALDEFEGSLMDYFKRYVREMNAVGMNKTLYNEKIPMAVDVLCMDYVTAIRDEKK